MNVSDEIMRYEIAKLDLRDGDVLVVRTDMHISTAQAQNLKTHMQKFVGTDNEVLVLGHGVELEVLRKQPSTLTPEQLQQVREDFEQRFKEPRK
jgi:hypothetical protein